MVWFIFLYAFMSYIWLCESCECGVFVALFLRCFCPILFKESNYFSCLIMKGQQKCSRICCNNNSMLLIREFGYPLRLRVACGQSAARDVEFIKFQCAPRGEALGRACVVVRGRGAAQNVIKWGGGTFSPKVWCVRIRYW